jgi:preprotein translocase subunit SecY
MNQLTDKIKLLWSNPDIRKRVGFLIVALLLFRALASIPVPGVDPLRLESFLTDNQFLGLLNIFSGGGLSGLSLVMLGVGPYITASIILQLLTVMVPKLKSLYHEEGQAGRRQFTQYARLLTVPLAIIQGFGFLTLLEQQGAIGNLALFDTFLNVIIIAAGSILLTWIGELISEYGIGNGVSIMIFAGIVAILPTQIQQYFINFSAADSPTLLAFLIAAVLIVAGIVFVNEAIRPVPITHSRQVAGGRQLGNMSTTLPLKLNQAGVMPIIFALSILLFPQMILNLLAGATTNPSFAEFSLVMNEFFNNLWLYGAVYFVLVFLFTYFYTAITFDVHETATNLQKQGAYVTGVRPGEQTESYLERVMTRVTFIGAIFLGLIAVLPIAMQAITGNPSLAIGGTALLIVVAVVIDLVKRLDAQVAMQQY